MMSSYLLPLNSDHGSAEHTHEVLPVRIYMTALLLTHVPTTLKLQNKLPHRGPLRERALTQASLLLRSSAGGRCIFPRPVFISSLHRHCSLPFPTLGLIPPSLILPLPPLPLSLHLTVDFSSSLLFPICPSLYCSLSCISAPTRCSPAFFCFFSEAALLYLLYKWFKLTHP